MAFRGTNQFFNNFEDGALEAVFGQVFLPTGSAAPSIRAGMKGLASVTRESAGVLKFKFSKSYPSGSLMSAWLTPWCSGTVPASISYDIKHANETHPTGAEVFMACLSGTAFPPSVQDPSIHLTGSAGFVFRNSKAR